MRILFLTHTFNSLAQRLFVELTGRGHDVSIEFDINDRVTGEAVDLFRPDLVLAPYLRRAIPACVWRRLPCLVVHPGPPGDRGPSALDWAILRDEPDWGVTVLQAEAAFDAGPVWGWATFPMRPAAKSSLYRHEVTEAAVTAVLQALARIERDERPVPAAALDPAGRQGWRPAMIQADRAIDWNRDGTAAVMRKIRASDGQPGVRDDLFGEPVFLYDGHEEAALTGSPGAVIARRHGALCRATTDGAVWIGTVRRPPAEGGRGLKLPATLTLAEHLAGIPERPDDPAAAMGPATWREITYRERDGVGHLHFAFANGAMTADQCRRLLAAWRLAQARPVRAVVLWGGPEFWSNGMHLGVIEAADSPADESWRTINAIDDLAEAIITTPNQLTIAAIGGNAGAGGVFLALAADRVLARAGVVLNPHYKGMGNLYGSEYWTYLLPRRAGPEAAAALTAARLPVSAEGARRLGLADAVLPGEPAAFHDAVTRQAAALAADPALDSLLAAKRERLARDTALRPLSAYRDAELERMKLNFYGFDPSYHVARHNFIFKVPHSRTPFHLARHRTGRIAAEG